MSTGVIGILILVGVGCLVLAAYVAQSVENAKQERHRQVLLLQERARKGWNLITEIPSCYLPAELRAFLLSYLSTRYNDILAIDPKNSSAHNQLSSLNELQNQPYSSNPDSPEPVLGDMLTTRNAAARVKDLVNFFVDVHKDGALAKNAAQQYINQGKAIYALIKTDLLQLTARQVEGSDNPRLALAHYSNCKKRLEPFEKSGQMPLRIQFLNTRITDLQQQVSKLEQEAASTSGEEKLEQEWDKFSQKDNDWKIKHEYE